MGTGEHKALVCLGKAALRQRRWCINFPLLHNILPQIYCLGSPGMSSLSPLRVLSHLRLGVLFQSHWLSTRSFLVAVLPWSLAVGGGTLSAPRHHPSVLATRTPPPLTTCFLLGQQESISLTPHLLLKGSCVRLVPARCGGESLFLINSKSNY